MNTAPVFDADTDNQGDVCRIGQGTAPLRIVLIEDSLVTSELLQLFLRRGGHTVSLAADGEAGLDMLLSEVFDLALVDFHLPKKNGLDLLVDFKSEAG